MKDRTLIRVRVFGINYVLWATDEALATLNLPYEILETNKPCPGCNGDGVLHTMDGDIIGPCTECPDE